MDFPETIQTARLSLVRPRVERAAALQAVVAASWPELTRFLHWTRHGLPDTLEMESRQAREAALWDRGEAFHCDLLERDSDAPIGKVSLFDLDPAVPRASLGYWLATAASGRGYMSEAVAALTAAGLERLALARIQIDCASSNRRSAGVARRCGYTLEGRLRHTGRDPLDGALTDTLIFARLGPDNREPVGDDRGREPQTP